MTGKIYRLSAGILLLCSSVALAADHRTLEAGLLDALRYDITKQERIGNSGKAIQAYMREEFAGKKPDSRADYTDYYVLKKPTKLLGHDLVLIEEEYMSRYVGCCVSPGAGVTVRVNGNSENLLAFAEANRCTFSDDIDIQGILAEVGIAFIPQEGVYASLSCRERDASWDSLP